MDGDDHDAVALPQVEVAEAPHEGRPLRHDVFDGERVVPAREGLRHEGGGTGPQQAVREGGAADRVRAHHVVRPGGPRSIAVHAEPVFLIERGVDPVEVLREWLGRDAFDASGDGEALLAEVLDMMACKAAVKAGDALGDREIAELLQQLDTLERATNCPHGRPTAMRIPWRELERRFGRA